MESNVDMQISYTKDYWISSFFDNSPINNSNIRKIKILQADLLQVSGDLSASERARRLVEIERNDLHDQLTQYTNREQQVSYEKRRLDAKISILEEELEEEQSKNAELVERARKTQLYAQQLTSDLAKERSLLARQESIRLQLERQNKELKEKYAEQETSHRVKMKAAIAEFESKIIDLEEQLEAEERERLEQQRNNRKLDKKIKMVLIQLEDQERNSDLYKQQLDRAKERVKILKQRLEEAEEEIFQEKGENRKLHKDYGGLLVSYESLTREISILQFRQEADCITPRLGDSKSGSDSDSNRNAKENKRISGLEYQEVQKKAKKRITPVNSK